jgi:4-amino-4-deoxy-L-arabinose transferase-like glycosyltransferase
MAAADSRPRAVLVLLVAIMFAASLWLARSHPLVDPDEGRNAEVGREMLLGGDFVVPHLAGMPYLDKPPGLFWAEAISFRLFGLTPFAARLPSAVAAALVLWLVGSLARARAGPRRMATVVALLGPAPLFLVLSAYAIFDMLLTLCVTAIWVLLVRETEGLGRPSAARRAAMFAALALGVLVKGPVMLAWGVGGSAAAALVLGSRRPLGWLAWWPGWLLFLGVAGGWFALAVARHPEYPAYAFVDETFRRMTSGAFKREQPLWFVPAVIVAGALPWSLGTPWVRRLGHASRVALGFILFAAFFFTISRSKLVTYLLPALPCLAWIAAAAWSEAGRSRRGAVGVALVLAALAAALLVFGRSTAWWGTRLDPAVIDGGRYAAFRLALTVGAWAAVAAAGAWARRAWPPLAACALFAPSVLVVAGPALSFHAATQSGAPLAAAIERVHPGARVRYENVYSPGTDFALGRTSSLVSELGHETTSNYQVFHRERLIARGSWTPRAVPDPEEVVDVIVRSSRRAPEPVPPGWSPFFRDSRFIAYHRPAASR